MEYENGDLWREQRVCNTISRLKQVRVVYARLNKPTIRIQLLKKRMKDELKKPVLKTSAEKNNTETQAQRTKVTSQF